MIGSLLALDARLAPRKMRAFFPAHPELVCFHVAVPRSPQDPRRHHHCHLFFGPAEEGPAQHLDARRASAASGSAAPGGTGLHAALRAGAGGSGDAGVMVVADAGIFGDILCARMMKRGVTALVTDGVVRDVEGVLGTNLPVWCDGYAAPPSVAGLTFVGWGEPIGCGGVAVFPNDIVVADQDGCVLIPQAMLEHVLNEGVEQERMEAWIGNEVNNGAALPGLYPMSAETKARYAASKKKQEQ